MVIGLKFSQKTCDERFFFVYNIFQADCSQQRGRLNGKIAGADRR